MSDPIKDALLTQELQKSAADAGAEAAAAPVATAKVAKADKADKTGKAEKEAIYATIETFLTNPKAEGLKAGEYGRQVFDLVVTELFAAVKKVNYVRFNDGNGALACKEYAEVTRKLPNGEVRTFGASHRIRYVMGASVSRLLDGTATPATAPEIAAAPVAVPATAPAPQADGATEVPETLDLD